MQCFHGTTLYITPQYNNDKKMTIVSRYLRSVNMNSFAPFSLVGESATLPEYKDRRLLMHDDACAVTDSRRGLPTTPPPSASRPRAPAHTYRENDHFHEHTGTLNVHQIILSILMSYCSSGRNLSGNFTCITYLLGFVLSVT